MPRKEGSDRIDDLDMFAAAGTPKPTAAKGNAPATNDAGLLEDMTVSKTPGTQIEKLNTAVDKLTTRVDGLQQKVDHPLQAVQVQGSTGAVKSVMQKMLNLLSTFGISQSDKNELQDLIDQL